MRVMTFAEEQAARRWIDRQSWRPGTSMEEKFMVYRLNQQEDADEQASMRAAREYERSPAGMVKYWESQVRNAYTPRRRGHALMKLAYWRGRLQCR